ncbi:MAG: aldo/keto reductase [Microbacterium chocolatum]|nr:aldo/keto reductase [Microbacterium chocolatum]
MSTSVASVSFSVGLGTLPLAGAYGSVGEDDALRVLHRAIDLGVELIDTADTYGLGRAERLIGRAISSLKGKVSVATKVGLVAGGRGGVRNDRKYLRAAVNSSRTRLGIERIDLLFLHRLDRTIPIEETVGILAELVREGTAASIGLSEVTASELERALAVHPITAVQSEWSVWSRDVERQVVPTCARTGVQFIAASPLGRGFLAGKTAAPRDGDHRRNTPRLQPINRASNLVIASEINRLATRQGVSPAQLLLVWLRHIGQRNGVRLTAIPGSRSIAQLEDNMVAAHQAVATDTLDAMDNLARMASGDRGNREWLSLGHE